MTDSEIDAIFEGVDQWLRLGDFERVEALLRDEITPEASPELLVSLLTITLAARDRLPSRAALFELARSRLDERTLRGLE